MSEIVITALTTLGVVATALGPVAVAAYARQNKTLSTLKHHVENSHKDETGAPYNLRDNIDANQAEVLAALGTIRTAIGVMQADVVGLKKDVGRLDDRDLARGRQAERMEQELGEVQTRLHTQGVDALTQRTRLDTIERKIPAWT